MDLTSLKRKELQALCKEHGIRANLTNIEMASRLKTVLEGKQQKRTKSCFRSFKNDVGDDDENEKVEGKKGKRVRFSPQNETFLFERTDPRERRLLARKMRTTGKSEIETNPVLVIENVGRVEEGEKNPEMNPRRRDVVKPGTVGEDPGNIGCVEKPVGRNLRRKSMAVLVSQDANNVEKGNMERNVRRRSMVKSGVVLVSSDFGNVEKPVEGETLERNVRSRGRKTIQKDVEMALSSPCVEKKAKRGRKGHQIVEEGVIDDTGDGIMVTRRKLRSREVRAENLGKNDDGVVADSMSNFLKKGANEKCENVVQVTRRSTRQIENGKAVNYASVCTGQGDDNVSNEDVANNHLQISVGTALDNKKRKRAWKKTAVVLDKLDDKLIDPEESPLSDKVVDDDIQSNDDLNESEKKMAEPVNQVCEPNGCSIENSADVGANHTSKEENASVIDKLDDQLIEPERSPLSDQVVDDNGIQSNDELNEGEKEMAELVTQVCEPNGCSIESPVDFGTDHTSNEENAAVLDKLDDQLIEPEEAPLSDQVVDDNDILPQSHDDLNKGAKEMAELVTQVCEPNGCGIENPVDVGTDHTSKEENGAVLDKLDDQLIEPEGAPLSDQVVDDNDTVPQSCENISEGEKEMAHVVNQVCEPNGCCMENAVDIGTDHTSNGSGGKSDNASKEAESVTIEISSAQRLDQFILDKKMEVGLEACIEADVQTPSIVEGFTPVSAAPIATVHTPMEESADNKTVMSLQNHEVESICCNKEPMAVESQIADTIEAMSESPTINMSYLFMQSGGEDVIKPNTPESSKVSNGHNEFMSSSTGELEDGLSDIGSTHQSKNKLLSKQENGPQESVCMTEGVKLKNEDAIESELLKSATAISEKLDDQVIEQEVVSGLGESCGRVFRDSEHTTPEVSDGQGLTQLNAEAKDVVLEPQVSITTLHKSLEKVETKEVVTPLQNRGVGFTSSNGEELNMVECQTKDGSDNMSQSFSTINTSWLYIESQVEDELTVISGSLKKGEVRSKETLRGDLSCLHNCAELFQEDIQSQDHDEHTVISSSLKMGEESHNESVIGDLSCIDGVENDKSLAVIQLEVESKKAAGVTIDNVLAMDAQGDYPVLQDRERDEVACEENTSPCNVDTVRNEEHVFISTMSGKTKDYSANPAQVQVTELSKGSYPGSTISSGIVNTITNDDFCDSSPLTTEEETKQIMENLCDSHIVQGAFGTNFEEFQFYDNFNLNYEIESVKCVDSVEKELDSLSHQIEYVEEAQVGVGSGGNEDPNTNITKSVDSVEKETSIRTGTGDDMREKGMSSDGNDSPKNTTGSKFDEAAGEEGIAEHSSLLIDTSEDANDSRGKIMDGCLVAGNNNCSGDHADGAEECKNASEYWSESLQTLFENEGSDTLHTACHADLEEVFVGDPYPQRDDQDDRGDEGVKASCDADQVGTKDILHQTMVEPQLFCDNVKESDRTKEDHVAQEGSEHAEVNGSTDACMAEIDNLASERPENLQSFHSDIAQVSDVTLIDQGIPDNSEEDFTDRLQEHNASPSMPSCQQLNCTGFTSAASASITILQVQGYNTALVETEVDSLPSSPMTNATNLDSVTDIHDIHESNSSQKLDVPGVLERAQEVMISNASSVPNNETSFKDCEAISDAVLVEGKEDIACKAMDNHSSINMPEQRGVLSDASQERYLDHLWEGEHGEVLVSEVSGEECDNVVEDFPKPCELGTESGLEVSDITDLSIKADVVSSSPCGFEDFTDQLQEHNASPSMSTCEQINSTGFISASSASITTLHETEENKDQKHNIESCMFSTWEMDWVWGEMAKDVGQVGAVGATSETSSLMNEDVATNVGENPMNVRDDVTCSFDYQPHKINEASKGVWHSNPDEVVISDENKAVNSSSSMVQREKNKSIMIHGTLRKPPLVRLSDMKENASALKMVDVTAVKPVAKRKALEDLRH